MKNNYLFYLISQIGFVSLFFFSSIACKKENNENKTIPTVVIVSISDITSSSAKITTKVTSEGGGTVSGTGICWGISINPDLSNNVSNVGGGLGQFISIPTQLDANTTYNVRAFATNELGTAYSSNMSFVTMN
jgi:hypothetical protein